MVYKNQHKAPEQAQSLIDQYLAVLRAAGRREQSLNTRRHQLIRICNVLDPLTMTESDILQWLGKQDWKPETRKSFRAGLRGFTAWMQASGVRPDDPGKDLPSVHTPKAQARPCPERFIEEAMSKANPEERIMLHAAAEYGMRRGEIARLHSDDVIDDLDGKLLIIHGKGGKERTLPITEAFANHILAADGYVFPGRFHGHVEESYIGKRLTRLLPNHWSGHTLRHRFATRSYQQTHDILLVSKALGHESVATTQRYIALPADSLRVMVNKVKIDSEAAA